MALSVRQAGCAYQALWLTLNRASSKTIQFTQPSGEKSVSEKIWLKEYPAGVPAEIDANRYRSIPDLVEKVRGKSAGKPAYHNFGYSMSYAELDRHSRDFTAFLQSLP